MLRVETEAGWWLITHQDHARLAADFAAHWGNQVFTPPEPRASVLHGIRVHDDGWAARDTRPCITKQGKPSAFSVELVGKYSAFEEIDLADYLAVRESALDRVEAVDTYAALIVAMHTYDLLSARADRATLAPQQLPTLDSFLQRQRERQRGLLNRLRTEERHANINLDDRAIRDNFRLLQATDNLSLYGCVNYTQPGSLLHPLPTIAGDHQTIQVFPIAARSFRLDPYPFDEPRLTFELPARYIEGKTFESSDGLTELYAAAPVQSVPIMISEQCGYL